MSFPLILLCQSLRERLLAKRAGRGSVSESLPGAAEVASAATAATATDAASFSDDAASAPATVDEAAAAIRELLLQKRRASSGGAPRIEAEPGQQRPGSEPTSDDIRAKLLQKRRATAESAPPRSEEPGIGPRQHEGGREVSGQITGDDAARLREALLLKIANMKKQQAALQAELAAMDRSEDRQ